jgi:hypothetical protein
MTQSNHNQKGTKPLGLENDRLDRELDVALAKFAAEPRAGLEERILANLHAQHERNSSRLWWPWPVVAALATAIVLSVSVTWKLGKPAQNTTAHQPAIVQPNQQTEMQVSHDGGSMVRPNRPYAKRPKPYSANFHAAVLASSPKLEQFPSPQPLSEQEKMLSDYVSEHRKQAIMVARARMAELKKDWAEEIGEASSPSNDLTSDPLASQQEDR